MSTKFKSFERQGNKDSRQRRYAPNEQGKDKTRRCQNVLDKLRGILRDNRKDSRIIDGMSYCIGDRGVGEFGGCCKRQRGQADS